MPFWEAPSFCAPSGSSTIAGKTACVWAERFACSALQLSIYPKQRALRFNGRPKGSVNGRSKPDFAEFHSAPPKVMTDTGRCALKATEDRLGGSDPSSGPRRLVRTPVAVHLLPRGEGKHRLSGLARSKHPFPSPRGEGVRQPALSPAGAGRVRGYFRAFSVAVLIASKAWTPVSRWLQSQVRWNAKSLKFSWNKPLTTCPRRSASGSPTWPLLSKTCPRKG